MFVFYYFGFEDRVYGRVKVRVNIGLGIGFMLFFSILEFGVKDLSLISMVRVLCEGFGILVFGVKVKNMVHVRDSIRVMVCVFWVLGFGV